VSQADVDVVRDQFAATNERDFERAMDRYAEDVVMEVSRAEGVRDPGTYEGKEAVGEWFGDWFRTFAPGYHFDVIEASDMGNGLVYLFAVHHGKGRLSGAEASSANAYLYQVHDLKIKRVGFFRTKEEALEAAALPEWSETETD
jgi:ketosteroid isomerase-like protein